MPFSVPTLSEVNRVVENGFSEAFYGTSGTLRVMVLKIISKVTAAAVYLVILLAAAIWKNNFTATADIDGLVRKGDVLTTPPKPASRARGIVIVTGTGGTSVPAGTVLVDDVVGNEYELLTSATIPPGLTSVTVQVYSVEFGSAYNLPAGTALTFRDAAPGTFTFAVDSEGLYGGASVDVNVGGAVQKWGETVEEYRHRLQVRERNQPVGGSVTDYWRWAMSFSEVSDCFVADNWPLTNNIAIYIADFRTNAISLNSTIINSVQTYVSSKDRRPASSQPVVGTVTPVPVAMTVEIPVVNDFYKESVLNALKSYFRKLGPGDQFSIDTVRQYIIDFGGVANCHVTNITVSGNVVPNEYSLGRSYSQSGTNISISGEVANVYLLPSLVTFENLV